MSEQANKWDFCDTCHSWMVRCGKCGNNCCNGGSGASLPEGESCPDKCASAYAMQDGGWALQAAVLRSGRTILGDGDGE